MSSAAQGHEQSTVVTTHGRRTYVRGVDWIESRAPTWRCARLEGVTSPYFELSSLASISGDQLARKILSMTSAPVVITGRSSRRYTTSVVRGLVCPTRRADPSTGPAEPEHRLSEQLFNPRRGQHSTPS